MHFSMVPLLLSCCLRVALVVATTAANGDTHIESGSSVAINGHVTPTFGTVAGGTLLTVFLDDEEAQEKEKLCRFSLLKNEKSFSIVAVATALDDKHYACETPNVAARAAHNVTHMHATVTLVSKKTGLPLSQSSPFLFKALAAVKSASPNDDGSGGAVVRVLGEGPGTWLNSSQLMCLFDDYESEATWIAPLIVDCIYPTDITSDVVVTISDNGVDRAKSESTLLADPYAASDETLASASPSITALSPQFGISERTAPVTVLLGTNLAAESQLSCVLLDAAGARVGSNLAEMVNETAIDCLITCPSVNATTKYLLGVAFDGTDPEEVYSSSMESFFCDPQPTVLDWTPKYISAGEPTPIKINMGEFRSALPVDCLFGANNQLTASPASHVKHGLFECLSPKFDRPQTVAFRVGQNNLALTEELQIEVVEPMSVLTLPPETIFAGSEVLVRGNNFILGQMSCRFGDADGSVESATETHVTCRSPAMTSPGVVEVSVGIKDAPQLNAMAGVVEILPAPRVDQITPSSGYTHGGTRVLVRGSSFHAIENPVCYFGGIFVTAQVLTETTIACQSPPPSEAGRVPVQVSLDGGNTLQGELLFWYFMPITLEEVQPRVAINGTKLRLNGEGFRFDLPVQCAIGGITFSEVTVVSPTEATCTFVAATKDDYRQASISLVTSDHTPASVGRGAATSVAHHPLVELSPVSPLYSSVMGGSIVEIEASGLYSNVIGEGLASIHCAFGEGIALATVVDESRVACVVPPANKAETVSLSLLYDGLPFSLNALEFEYTLEPKILGIHPTLGPHTGGTSIRVQGLNLVPSSEVSCRFGSNESDGYFDANQNALICVSPPLNKTS